MLASAAVAIVGAPFERRLRVSRRARLAAPSCERLLDAGLELDRVVDREAHQDRQHRDRGHRQRRARERQRSKGEGGREQSYPERQQTRATLEDEA